MDDGCDASYFIFLRADYILLTVGYGFLTIDCLVLIDDCVLLSYMLCISKL